MHLENLVQGTIVAPFSAYFELNLVVMDYEELNLSSQKRIFISSCNTYFVVLRTVPNNKEVFLCGL